MGQSGLNGAVRSLVVTLLRSHSIFKEHFFDDCADQFPVYQGKYRDFSVLRVGKRNLRPNYDATQTGYEEIPYKN